MSHKSAKNITRRSWDTIPMPDTVIARVNKISCNEPNKFIFTDRIVCPVGDVETTGVDRDTDYINKNKAPQDPPCKFQETEEIEEEPVIKDPRIELNINHETPTGQVQAPKEPPEDPITVAVQPPTTETNTPHQPSAGVRRYSRVITQTKSYTPSMSGNRYAYATAEMAEQEVLHSDDHVLLN